MENIEPQINEIAAKYIEQIVEVSKVKEPLVVIQCLTYNHEKYLRDALEGFVMQKTSFPFVAIVHDDASTDNTAEVLREYAEKYPDIILPIYEEENQYSKPDAGVGPIMRHACTITGAKYIAFCEGDDYWTDPMKLQKQVDFLESHPDYGMCYGKVNRFNQKINKISNVGGNGKCSFEELIEANCIPTATVLLHKKLYFEYLEEIQPAKHHWRMGDKPCWLWISLHRKIYFFDEIFGVYRILEESASHNKSFNKWLSFIINAVDVSMFFMRYAKLDESKVLQDYYFYNIAYSVKVKDDASMKKYCKLLKDTSTLSWEKMNIIYRLISIFPKFTTSLMEIIFKWKNLRGSW